ncbi:Predicted dehydrogenase [Paenibacillus sp. UNC496MF]|uniref:Gfo/Idh/MocA family protein n=1 Tax=Paenibacillus sp. UNC496MF TaxID=1502753 RepID=UPI0008E6E80E|nr:Gfo/Idh/MocA family oxidoreductase [Paenibacillus sp. UNC496MF]SFJ49148.1 Predicted dehydrogenase [Paenibacillus sp. UNC496MF]
MMRIAILSFWHVHAKDYALQAERHPDTEVAAVWDENPARGRAEAEARGVPYYAGLAELLARPDIDAVIVTAPTAMHRAVIGAAARAGKHAFTEKVLAPTVRECRELLADVRASGVQLTVSLPRLNMPFALAAQEVASQGLLGRLTQVRARLAHKGALSASGLPEHFYRLAESAGGAMIDLGCHPMVLTRLLLGMPESVSASYGYVTGREAEDNAAVVLRYANGAIGIVEAGFVNPLSPFTLEAHGTEGSLSYSLHSRKLIVASLANGDNPVAEWPLPEALPSDFEQWVARIGGSGLEAGARNLETAFDLTRLMEASNRSARSGRAVRLDELEQEAGE